jgi:putative glutamine amidotransferase
MPNLATWMRSKDEKWFRPIFERFPTVRICNALQAEEPMDRMSGLLLTGGADISKEFLHQEIPDESVLDKDVDPKRDAWEFAAVNAALVGGLPIFAICKGLQVFNVALGGTLKLDIPGHNLPEMRDHDVQPLRTERSAAHRLERVNSSHHQAIDRLADGCEVEAWCATDGIIEQMRLRDHPFALAVQYHPERGGELYAPLFKDFLLRVENHAVESLNG